MDIKLHEQATTTPAIRAEIQAASCSNTDSELARQYGLATATIRRWRYLNDAHNAKCFTDRVTRADLKWSN